MNWLSVIVGKGGLSAEEEAFSDRNQNCLFSACLNSLVSAGPELLISVKPMHSIDSFYFAACFAH